MPTNRAGDKTATQAPSTKPEPEGTITQALPADGDPDNASTFAQAFKVDADWIDFLLKPQAKTGDYAGPLMNFRTALGHRRFRIDHMALPAGQIQHWRENWGAVGGASGFVGGSGTTGPVDLCRPVFDDLASKFNDLSTHLGVAAVAANLAAVQTALGTCATDALAAYQALHDLQGLSRWQVLAKKTTGTSSVIRIGADTISSSRFSYQTFQCGDTSGDFISLFSTTDCAFSDDLNWYVEFPIKVSAADLVKLTASVGVALADGVPPFDASGPLHYAVFSLPPGGGNWQYSYRGGGSAQGASTGVAASTSIVRMRIEFHGATVADNTTRAMRFYINGALVGTITTDIPTSTNRVSLHFSLQNTAGGAHGLSNPLNLGPVSFSSNLFPSDVV